MAFFDYALALEAFEEFSKEKDTAREKKTKIYGKLSAEEIKQRDDDQRMFKMIRTKLTGSASVKEFDHIFYILKEELEHHPMPS